MALNHRQPQQFRRENEFHRPPPLCYTRNALNKRAEKKLTADEEDDISSHRILLLFVTFFTTISFATICMMIA